MYLLANEVLLTARDANIFLWAKHIPGERNAIAYLLSRMNRVVHTEWTLLQYVTDALSISSAHYHLGHTQCGPVRNSTQQHIHCVCFPPWPTP